MATNMAAAMVVWMRFRGHRWVPVAEMAGAMYLPFLVLFPSLWVGVLSATGLRVLGHLLMLLAMAAVMLRRAVSTPASTVRRRGEQPLLKGLLPLRPQSRLLGEMFWLIRKKLSGSYFRLRTWSRSYFFGPYDCLTRSAPSSPKKFT
jgi:hypothetical protein